MLCAKKTLKELRQRGVGLLRPILEQETVTQVEILAYIMEISPPRQVASGAMTALEWADCYMSDVPDGYRLVLLSPHILAFPDEPVWDKVIEMSMLPAKTSPPVVVDLNDKMEVRIGGGRLRYIVLDGKHRVAAARKRGDKTILAFVPANLVDELQRASHWVELGEYACNYFKEKGYGLLQRTDRHFIVNRNGDQRTYTTTDIENIARNRGDKWSFKT